MPEGITILSSHNEIVKGSEPILVFLLCLALGCSGLLIYLIFNRMKNKLTWILTMFVVALLCAALIFGMVTVCQTRETLYNVTLSDDFPAQKLFQNYDVRKVDGLIYTIVEKKNK